MRRNIIREKKQKQGCKEKKKNILGVKGTH